MSRFINWSACHFSPNGGGSVVNLDGVTQCSIDAGISKITFSGDGDQFPTQRKTVMQDPSITLTCANIDTVRSLIATQEGTLQITQNHANTGAATGAIIWSLANASISNRGVSGAHKQFASSSLKFECYSSDGSNPLTHALQA